MEWLLLLLLPAALVLAAGYDVATYTIPNWLSLAIAAVFPAMALIAGMPITTFGLHLAIGVATLTFGIVLFAMRLFGGGDAKLMAAAALWMGPQTILSFLVGTAMVGGALATAILLFRRIPLPPELAARPWAMRIHSKDKGVPYGVAIAGGGLAIYYATPIAVYFGAN
jgi:prepilin peptidase CpaA